jgi:hypothetical protein
MAVQPSFLTDRRAGSAALILNGSTDLPDERTYTVTGQVELNLGNGGPATGLRP